MPRFYIPHPRIENELLRVKGPEVRHIRQVLRLRKGDEITLFDGSGKTYQGRLVEESPTSVFVKIEDIFCPKTDSFLEITLAQSLLKGEKMDYLIQKATELGVTEIIPFISSRSIPLLDKKKQLEKHHRWERIAIEASKQCNRGYLPKMTPLCHFSEMLSLAPSDSIRLILYEKRGRRLKEVLRESKKLSQIFFVIGPEGGLSKEEIEESQEKGFIPIFLGERILRAETASLCLLSILQYEKGDLG